LSQPVPQSAEPPVPYDGRDFAPLIGCSLIWGSTWFAITFQLGSVPAAVSVAYRFALAGILLFAWLAVARRPIRLTPAQHLATAAQGALTFGINYIFVYFAEARLPSAVVAVIFAALAFVNLAVFRLALGIRAPRRAWAGAVLGVAGVAALFLGELGRANLSPRVLAGLGFGLVAMLAAALGNLAARRAQTLHVEVGANAAWGMVYGAAIVAIGATATGQRWRFDFSSTYVGSLLYLAVFGSVIAFVLYFSLARRRGYVLASYISAVTPAIAMVISAVFEHAHWGVGALAGLVLIVAGQVLLAKTPKGA
jgi:drug/metabolite transporter (DMT)-like permease